MKNKKEYDYSRLKGKIRELYGSDSNLAYELGWSGPLLSLKLNNKSGMTQDDIIVLVDKLKIPYSEIHSYFLKEKPKIDWGNATRRYSK